MKRDQKNTRLFEIVTLSIIILSAILLTSCVRITDANGNVVQLRSTEQGLSGVVQQQTAETKTLKALVKGSIYGTGEFVSVYGTCLDNEDAGWLNSTGELSAWYPNGTQFFTNSTMQEIQPGYFVYTGYMSPVSGTYLTEFICRTPEGYIAKAFGEWQNPMWVQYINDTRGTLEGMNGTLNNLSNTLNNLSNNTEAWFNITWDKIDNINATINATFANITTELQYIATVANGSVDRNDSYLANMLQLLAASQGVPQTGVLNVTVVADYPTYRKNWDITATVINEYGVQVGDPTISCFINTTNAPNTIMERMEPSGSDRLPTFFYREKVETVGDFTWSVGCVYN